MSEHPSNPLQQLYIDYLVREGYRPTVDQDGDLIFKREGKTWLLFVDPDDPTFFRLVFPNFWPIESEEERLRVYQSASLATGQTKVSKVYVVNDNVWATSELFLPEPELFPAVFARALEAATVAVRSFVAGMTTED